MPTTSMPPPEQWPPPLQTAAVSTSAPPQFGGVGMLAPPPSSLGSVPPPAQPPEMQAHAAMASAAVTVDPEAEARRQRELATARAERAKQLKRGPGVAALVQGALKRAQTQTPTVKKPEDEKEESAKKAPEKAQEVESDEESEEAVRKRKEEMAQAELQRRKEKEQREAAEREKAEKEARERREQAKREAEETEKALQKKEAETREQRIKASVEAAKKQQAERAIKAAKEAAATDSLYGDMPQPDPEKQAVLNEAKMKEAVLREKANNLSNLPPEDRSKVVFLDIDGVLRPARAGGFDILSVDGDAAVRVDTSDFFPSAMKALRHIMERTGAIVVLSSEWRRSETLLLALADTFEKNRMRLWGSVTATSLDIESGPDPVRSFAERRAREVTKWLQDHEGEVSGWVVLDDINLAIADEAKKASTKQLGARLVQTWPLCGLTMGNAKTAVRILNGEMINKVVVERPVAPGGGLSTPMPRAAATGPGGAAPSAPGGATGGPAPPGPVSGTSTPAPGGRR